MSKHNSTIPNLAKSSINIIERHQENRIFFFDSFEWNSFSFRVNSLHELKWKLSKGHIDSSTLRLYNPIPPPSPFSVPNLHLKLPHLAEWGEGVVWGRRRKFRINVWDNLFYCYSKFIILHKLAFLFVRKP